MWLDILDEKSAFFLIITVQLEFIWLLANNYLMASRSVFSLFIVDV